MVKKVAETCSGAAGAEVLDTLLAVAAPELEKRLRFMKPALDFARDGDEAILASLPQAEEEIARRIARDILGDGTS